MDIKKLEFANALRLSTIMHNLNASYKYLVKAL